MQLHEQYSDRVHVISLNVDFDDEGVPAPPLIDQVREMLVKQRVTCEAIMSTDPSDLVLDELNLFSLPAALLYDERGTLVKAFEGTVDFESDVEPVIREIVAAFNGSRP